MFRSPKIQRAALLISLLTALWFSLGGVLKIWVALNQGSSIEMVVCSGAGLKKIHLPTTSSEQTSPEVVLKHCSNAPLALLVREINTLDHLSYTTPQSFAAWYWLNDAGIKPAWFINGQPPPGRAPPVALA